MKWLPWSTRITSTWMKCSHSLGWERLLLIGWPILLFRLASVHVFRLGCNGQPEAQHKSPDTIRKNFRKRSHNSPRFEYSAIGASNQPLHLVVISPLSLEHWEHTWARRWRIGIFFGSI